MILVTCQAPDFTASAVLGNGEIIHDFNLKKFIQNKTAVIFFWPMDFTFVCPSELLSFNKRYLEFQKHNVKILGISCDSVFVHRAWRLTPLNKGGIGEIKYPMIADTKHEIMKNYGIEHPHYGVALRGSFLIDQKGIIRHQVINDLPLGRNIDEMMRMVHALHFHEQHGEVCPAQWTQGSQGIHPSPDGISKYLSENLNNL